MAICLTYFSKLQVVSTAEIGQVVATISLAQGKPR